MAAPDLSILNWFSYDPATGVFRHNSPGQKKRVGVVAGSLHTRGYIRLHFQARRLMAHRVAWFFVHREWRDDVVVDHINGDPADNRIANLRLADKSQNGANSKGRMKGVDFRRGKRGDVWVARIKKDRKSIHIGTFHSVEEAREAYFAAATKLFGEFARFE